MPTKLHLAAALAALTPFGLQDPILEAPKGFSAPAEYRSLEARVPVVHATAIVLDALYQISAAQPGFAVGETPWGRYEDPTPLPPTIAPGRALDRFGAVRMEVQRVVSDVDGARAAVTLDFDLVVPDAVDPALVCDVLVLALGSVAGLEVVAHPTRGAATTEGTSSWTGLRVACSAAAEPDAVPQREGAGADAPRPNPASDAAAFFVGVGCRATVALGRVSVAQYLGGELVVTPPRLLKSEHANNWRNFLIEVSRTTESFTLARLQLGSRGVDGWDVRATYHSVPR